MFLLWLLGAVASAQDDCPDVRELVDAGWEAYEEAELERARELIVESHESLSCQTRVIGSDELLLLYRLDALVSITMEDNKGAVYATIRAVTLDPEVAPPAEDGPELAELHATWADRLREATATLRVAGSGDVYVDGVRMDETAPLQVLEGEHLVQFEGVDGWVCQVRDVVGDNVIETGRPSELPEGPIEPPIEEPDEPPIEEPDEPPIEEPDEPIEEPVEDPDPDPGPDRPRRRHRVGLLVTGGVIAAAGGGVAGYAFTEELAFKNDDFYPDSFGACQKGQTCYLDARQSAIVEEAERVQLLYGIGYGVAAVGVLVLGTELIILPAPTAGGGSLHLTVDW